MGNGLEPNAPRRPSSMWAPATEVATSRNGAVACVLVDQRQDSSFYLNSRYGQGPSRKEVQCTWISNFSCQLKAFLLTHLFEVGKPSASLSFSRWSSQFSSSGPFRSASEKTIFQVRHSKERWFCWLSGIILVCMHSGICTSGRCRWSV